MGRRAAQGAGADDDALVYDDLGSEELAGAPVSMQGRPSLLKRLGTWFAKLGRAIAGQPLWRVANGKTLDPIPELKPGDPGYRRYQHALTN
jgi:hypothetical protein